MSTTDDVCELRRRLLVALLWRAACLTWLREAIEDEDRRRTMKRAVIMVPNMNPDASRAGRGASAWAGCGML